MLEVKATDSSGRLDDNRRNRKKKNYDIEFTPEEIDEILKPFDKDDDYSDVVVYEKEKARASEDASDDDDVENARRKKEKADAVDKDAADRKKPDVDEEEDWDWGGIDGGL